MQEVSRNNLVPGKEYYLQSFAPMCLPPNKPFKMIAKFEKIVHLFIERACFTNFRNLKDRNNPSCGSNIELALHWKFYEINGPTIQKNMENRAYKQVLLDIVKDENFIRVEVV
jgi:hypothetical protein